MEYVFNFKTGSPSIWISLPVRFRLDVRGAAREELRAPDSRVTSGTPTATAPTDNSEEEDPTLTSTAATGQLDDGDILEDLDGGAADSRVTGVEGKGKEREELRASGSWAT
jgi:hypothetical protein